MLNFKGMRFAINVIFGVHSLVRGVRAADSSTLGM